MGDTVGQKIVLWVEREGMGGRVGRVGREESSNVYVVTQDTAWDQLKVGNEGAKGRVEG